MSISIASPPRGVTTLDRALALAYALDTVARVNEMSHAGRFGPVEQITLRWEGRHTPAELRQLFSTFSPWLALPADDRAALLDDIEALARDRFDAVIVRPYQTVMYLAQRRG